MDRGLNRFAAPFTAIAFAITDLVTAFTLDHVDAGGGRPSEPSRAPLAAP
jgi:hypothetical protein